MPKTLTEDQVAQYRRDGYLCPLPALSAEEVAHYRGRLESFEAAQGATLGQLPGHLRAKTHLLFTWMDALVRHPAILDAVEDLIGPDIRVYHLTAWLKEPGEGSFVPWHQDATYFNLDPPEHVTAWLALSDSTEASGCVRVLPGSQTTGQLAHVNKPSAQNLLSNGQQLESAVDDAPAVSMAVPAGSFSLHHTHIVHSSDANRGADRRLGLGISYIPAHVRCTSRVRLTGAMVRGEDRYGFFEPEPRPKADFDAAARSFHARACARFFESHGAERVAVAEGTPIP